MQGYFDALAGEYDTSFTQSAIGKAQRDRVWNYLELHLLKNRNQRILEVNGGTGADAAWFWEKGNQVCFSDASPAMVEVARQNLSGTDVRVLQADFLEIFLQTGDAVFDLIFSNFGGLNCISPEELRVFLTKANLALKPGGDFVAVVMPRFCVWESLYFLLKEPSKTFRRWSGKAEARMPEITIPVYYFSPFEFAEMAPSNWKVQGLVPVGFFIPPSNFSRFMEGKPGLMKSLSFLEKQLSNHSPLAGLSDHYLIHFKKTRS
jgi:ubiquinone/menaquinone biosynthesis C-methylase UbiE